MSFVFGKNFILFFRVDRLFTIEIDPSPPSSQAPGLKLVLIKFKAEFLLFLSLCELNAEHR